MKFFLVKILRRAALTVIMGLFTTQAYGAEIFYVPQSMEVSVDAGSNKTVPLTVGLTNGGRSDFRLFFLDSISGGNLPLSWIQVFPTLSFLSSAVPSDTTSVTIGVPSGTTPGSYTGRVLSMAAGPEGLADSGNGMLLTVRVASRCSQMPAIGINSFSPKSIWPPNNRTVPINVSGTISVPDGCTLSEAHYRVEDEYGQFSGQGPINSDADGEFTLSIPVGASRNGKDADGRTYTISLTASDELGGTTTILQAVVPHDMKGK